VNPKNFLSIAEDYAIFKGDKKIFKETYQKFRADYNVRASVRLTLEYLYGADLAKFLEGYDTAITKFKKKNETEKSIARIA
jgi:hypothetical protein